MADYKTAEQYVVEKLETTEMELDNAKIEHKAEMEKVLKDLAELNVELNSAYELLNMFRDFITVRKSDYFGNCIDLNTIYEKEHTEEVARIMEYFDIRPEEDEEDAGESTNTGRTSPEIYRVFRQYYKSRSTYGYRRSEFARSYR